MTSPETLEPPGGFLRGNEGGEGRRHEQHEHHAAEVLEQALAASRAKDEFEIRTKIVTLSHDTAQRAVARGRASVFAARPREDRWPPLRSRS